MAQTGVDSPLKRPRDVYHQKNDEYLNSDEEEGEVLDEPVAKRASLSRRTSDGYR